MLTFFQLFVKKGIARMMSYRHDTCLQTAMVAEIFSIPGITGNLCTMD